MTRASSPPKWNAAQAFAIGHEGDDLVVSASAGTGKTTVLVERILRKLRDGTAPDLRSLLVVTFTEKAAQEMRSRIYRNLVDDARLRPQLAGLPRAHISTIHAFCARLLRENALLAGVEPGFRVLDQVGSRDALDEAMTRTFHDWYRHENPGLRSAFVRLVESMGFGASGENLREVVARIFELSRTHADPERFYAELIGSSVVQDAAPPAPGDPEDSPPPFGNSRSSDVDARALRLPWMAPALEAFRDDVRLALQVLQEGVERARAEGKRVNLHFAFLEGLHRVARPGADRAGMRRTLASMEADGFVEPPEPTGRLRFRVPDRPRGSGAIAGCPELFDAARALLDRLDLRPVLATDPELLAEARALRDSTEVLVRIAREMQQSYLAFKSRNGFLDFSDLEAVAVRTLQEHGGALALTDRFAEVLVDECQDVNPMQERILELVSRPGNRFRVGDVKQSIYRFRLADPSIFLGWVRRARKAEVEPGDPETASVSSGATPDGASPVERARGAVSSDAQDATASQVVYLGENHRSRPEILDFVNHVFGQVFRSADIGSDYEVQRLVAARETSGTEIPVEIDLITLPARRLARSRVLEHAADLAKLPQSEAATTLTDLLAESDEIPPASAAQLQARWAAERVVASRADFGWDEMAILLRSGTRARVFEEELRRADVPVSLMGGGSLLEEPGVRDLHHLLRLVDNPRDDISMAAVLRSPIVGLSDGELLAIRLAVGPDPSFFQAARRAARTGSATGSVTGTATGSATGTATGSATGTATGSATGSARDLDTEPDGTLDEGLRDRLRAFFVSLEDWRRAAELEDLSHLVSRILAETSYAALMEASGEGPSHQVQLESYLELVRSFERERGPSLRGFLGRVETLERSGGIEAASSAPAGGGAVTLLTVHRSKGLEFPLVIVPQLEWRFLGHERLGGQIRVGPHWIGQRLLDTEAWVRRDTVARRALERIENEEGRAEEARILYVAMTRARERLVLAGVTRARPWEEPALPEVLREGRIRRATAGLDWVLHTLPWEDVKPEEVADGGPASDEDSGSQAEMQRGAERGAEPGVEPDVEPGEEPDAEPDAEPGAEPGEEPDAEPDVESGTEPDAEPETRFRFAQPRVEVRAVPARRFERRDAAESRTAGSDRDPWRRATAETTSPGASRLLDRVFQRPASPPLALLEDLRGKYWVTELKQPGDAPMHAKLREEAAGFLRSSMAPGSSASAWRSTSTGTDAGTSAAELGSLYHALLAKLDPTTDPAQIPAAIEQMTSAPWWGGAARDPQIESGIQAFIDSDLGRSLAQASETAEREVAFSLRWPVVRLLEFFPQLRRGFDPRWSDAEWLAALERAWILLQGRIDCLFHEDGGWCVIDWKTDRLDRTSASEKADAYRSQMAIYAEAVARLWGAPVRAVVCFLRSGEIVEVVRDVR